MFSILISLFNETIYQALHVDNIGFNFYIYYMTVTVDVTNQKALNLLKTIEGVKLIHVSSSKQSQTAEEAAEKTPPYHWMRGCHKGLHNGTVEDFLADCRTDKEHELEIERRQEEERARLAKLHT